MTDTPFHTIKTLKDLTSLITGGGAESLYLEFKATDALSGESIVEICKDVTAFANSAGGQIIYGISEDKKTQSFTLDSGVSNPKITREWIDNILRRVQPPLQGVRIDQITISEGHSAFVLTIPQTQTGPHQATDHKYYQRTDLHVQPMNDFAVQDVRRRSTSPLLNATIAFDTGLKKFLRYASDPTSESGTLYVSIENLSTTPALYTSLVLGVDVSMQISHVERLTSMGQATDRDGKPFAWYRRHFAVPTDMPIFKEDVYGRPDCSLSFNFPPRNAIMQYDVRIYVQTPGFAQKRDWIIHKFGQQVEIEPDPGQ
jgi:Putative DNA-binding domain